jgi:hypothetical protein
VRGSLGAEDGILCLDEVGREPEPTLVFCDALDPFEPDRVGELEMIAMSRLSLCRGTILQDAWVAQVLGPMSRRVFVRSSPWHMCQLL